MFTEPFVAGIDLGGTKIAGALGGLSGQILAETSIATEHEAGPDHVLHRTSQLVRELEKQAGVRAAALGVGLPGLMDVETGIARFLPNLATQWRGVAVAETLKQTCGVPVFTLNDARIATLGEQVFGAGRDASSFLLMTIGTGIGGGIVLDGLLRLGRLGAAGEVGHQTLQPDGPVCGCGNRGCVEALASGPAMTREGIRLMQTGEATNLERLAGGDASTVNPSLMAEAFRAGDTTVGRAIEQSAEWLGIAAANVITAMALELVVLTGGMSALGDLLTVPMLRVIRERVHMFPPDDIQVVCSKLGAKAGILGGIALAAGKILKR